MSHNKDPDFVSVQNGNRPVVARECEERHNASLHEMRCSVKRMTWISAIVSIVTNGLVAGLILWLLSSVWATALKAQENAARSQVNQTKIEAFAELRKTDQQALMQQMMLMQTQLQKMDEGIQKQIDKLDATVSQIHSGNSGS